MNLSGVVLTKNEENNIAPCIDSLTFCDEIIVIDDNSIDKTIKIAKNKGAKVFKRSLNNNYADQRNYGLEMAQGKWVLFIDADERVTKELKNEIIKFIDKPQQHHRGVYIKREDVFLNKKMNYGEARSVKLIRLGRKGAGKWKRRVHEYWDISGSLYLMKYPLLHYSYDNFGDFVKKLNKFSSLHALANKEENKKSFIIKIIVWPQFKFIYIYIFKLGVLDGTHGFVHAASLSFHSFLSWSKLWILQKNQP